MAKDNSTLLDEAIETLNITANSVNACTQLALKYDPSYTNSMRGIQGCIFDVVDKLEIIRADLEG